MDISLDNELFNALNAIFFLKKTSCWKNLQRFYKISFCFYYFLSALTPKARRVQIIILLICKYKVYLDYQEIPGPIVLQTFELGNSRAQPYCLTHYALLLLFLFIKLSLSTHSFQTRKHNTG